MDGESSVISGSKCHFWGLMQGPIGGSRLGIYQAFSRCGANAVRGPGYPQGADGISFKVATICEPAGSMDSGTGNIGWEGSGFSRFPPLAVGEGESRTANGLFQ